MNVTCPFINVFQEEIECGYLDNFGNCNEIEVNPHNGDAWCNIMINKGLQQNTFVKDLLENTKALEERKET